MKLYIREKVFSWADKFSVLDDSGRERYIVEGELFSWGKKLHVYDYRGEEAAFIQQKLFTFLPRYKVFVHEEEVAEIVKEFSFLFPRYSIEGLGWEIDGDFMAHNYTITQKGRTIVTIHKQWMTWGDCYELNIRDAGQELMALAVVLAIDCVTESQGGVSGSVSSD